MNFIDLYLFNFDIIFIEDFSQAANEGVNVYLNTIYINKPVFRYLD